MAEKCRATSWRTAFCHPPEKRFLRGAAHSGVFAVRRLAFLPLFGQRLTAVSARGNLCTFLTAKSTKNSPADASAYFVPANVRNGRLFAGAHAPRPRFLPLLAGPSFHGSGIGPESFAAFRGGKDASGTSRKHRSLRSPLEAGFNRRIIAWSGRRTTDSPRARAGGCKGLILLRPLNAGRRLFPRKATCGWFWYFCHQKYRESRDDVAGVLYLFSAKGTQKLPADASAYFVPANVRNGRLFAGLQANRPRFLPLLAGPSFHGYGIGPESFAAFRGGKDASGTSRKHRSLRSPPKGGWGERNGSKNPQVAGLQTTRAAQADAPKGWGERKD